MKQSHLKRRFINLRHLSVLPTGSVFRLPNNQTHFVQVPQASCKEVPTVRKDERRRRNKMQDTTMQTDLHSPHIGGDLPPITSEPTGSPGNNEPTVHDVPTGPLIETPPVAGVQSPLPLKDTRAQQRTFLPQRGLYYTAIAGIIAGEFTALLTMVVTLVFAGTSHPASQQIAVDKLTVTKALALPGLELLNVKLSMLIGFAVGL